MDESRKEMADRVYIARYQADQEVEHMHAYIYATRATTTTLWCS